MSKTSQRDPRLRHLPEPDAAHPAVGYASDEAAGRDTGWHSHACDQLLYASQGLMRVDTQEGLWVTPSLRAVWIPAGVVHRKINLAAVTFRTLYVLPEAARMPERCHVLNVSPLLRELIVEMTRHAADYDPDGPAGRLLAVLFDQLRAAPSEELYLPLPEEPRIRALVSRLLEEPDNAEGLDELARGAGASPRTMARLFEAETGMGFREWRQRLRLQVALARLAEGEPVTSVAYAVGYDSPSAFIAMFRKAMGESPKRYLTRGQAPAEPTRPD